MIVNSIVERSLYIANVAAGQISFIAPTDGRRQPEPSKREIIIYARLALIILMAKELGIQQQSWKCITSIL